MNNSVLTPPVKYAKNSMLNVFSDDIRTDYNSSRSNGRANTPVAFYEPPQTEINIRNVD